jgi:hypothetical protein
VLQLAPLQPAIQAYSLSLVLPNRPRFPHPFTLTSLSSNLRHIINI